MPRHLRIRREGTLRSRAARGDAAAFAAVYERHHQALYRYCRSILRHEEDAQDALQSTMARAFAALQDEQRDFELRPWLFRIAHNEAISILRRRRDDRRAGATAAHRASWRTGSPSARSCGCCRWTSPTCPSASAPRWSCASSTGSATQEIGVVLELSTGAVKQAIFEARTALFSCREGREMACHDVRRMLSDGDGRVLRGRGVRAHLRSCPDCRRFKADLEQRPKALRALAPPLPVGGRGRAAGAAARRWATAAKLLACVAIAGGGTTLAVEMQHAREPPRRRGREHRRSRARATAGDGRRDEHADPAARGGRSRAAPRVRDKAKDRAKAKRRRQGQASRPAPRRPRRARAAHGQAEAQGQGHTARPQRRRWARRSAAPRSPGQTAIGKTQAPRPGQAAKAPKVKRRWQGDRSGPGQEVGADAGVPPGQAKKADPDSPRHEPTPEQVGTSRLARWKSSAASPTPSAGPAEWFTGDVFIDEISPGPHVKLLSVHFTPGARTAWHAHPFGQTIHVTEGLGLFQVGGRAGRSRCAPVTRCASTPTRSTGTAPTRRPS